MRERFFNKEFSVRPIDGMVWYVHGTAGAVALVAAAVAGHTRLHGGGDGSHLNSSSCYTNLLIILYYTNGYQVIAVYAKKLWNLFKTMSLYVLLFHFLKLEYTFNYIA